MFIEYSVDTLPNKRFFYGLKVDSGEKYFQTDSGFFEYTSEGITVDENEFLKRKIDSINYFVYLKNEEDHQEKEYLFSVSPYKSMVELQELGTENRFTWTLKDFLNYNEYDIFPYEVFLEELKSENAFLITFAPKNNTENIYHADNVFSFKKFKLNSFSENAFHEIISGFNNDPNRKQMSNLFAIDYVGMFGIIFINSKRFFARYYDYSFNYNKDLGIASGTYNTLNNGDEIFYKHIWLKDEYHTFIFFPDKNNGNKVKINVCTLFLTETQMDRKDFLDYAIDGINFNTGETMSDFIKMDEKNVAFVTTVDNTEDTNGKLHIFFFHFSDDYKQMKMRHYSYDMYDYIFLKEISASFYNNYLVFDAIAILKKENMEDDDLVNYFSIFMIFGYVNETTINKDLSPILSDNDNYAQNINLVSFLYEDIIIDNNIFGYIPDDKIVLISYPDEISIIKEDDETPIESNTILYKNQNYKVKQNTNLEKTDKYYYIKFQPIIKEPNFADLYNNADDFITYPTDADYNFESEYEPKIFYGKNNKLQFKLCHEYCAKCKEIGVSNNNQKCLSCLPNYQYDYWFYKNINIGNCVPEGYYNDKESGLLGLCNSLPNAKFYLNKTDNKRICFKSEYDCPESYPLFNETKNECYNNFIPTTILTKIPTTIPTKISTIFRPLFLILSLQLSL